MAPPNSIGSGPHGVYIYSEHINSKGHGYCAYEYTVSLMCSVLTMFIIKRSYSKLR